MFNTVEPISSPAKVIAARFLSASSKASISGGYSFVFPVSAPPSEWFWLSAVPGIEAGDGGGLEAFAASAQFRTSVPLGVLFFGVRFAIRTAIFRAAPRAGSVVVDRTAFSTKISGAPFISVVFK